MSRSLTVARPRLRLRTRVVGRLRAVDPWTWAWAGFALVTIVAVVGNDFGVFAPDTKPELYLNPDRLLGRSLAAWQPDPHLGQANYNTGILPVAALMTAVQATGLVPWLMQRLFMVVLLLVGAWGAGRLVTELSGRQGGGPWMAGVVYAWHPWVVVGAATLPVRLPHVVLPWLLIATHRAVTRGGWGPAAAAGLAYGAMAGINGGVVNLMLVLPVLLLVGWTIATRQATARHATAGLVRVGLFAVGLSLYWLVPSLVAAGSSAGDVLLATEDAADIGTLSPPAEVLRGMGMWTSYIVINGQIENPEQLRLLTSPFVVTAGFLLMALAASGLVSLQRRLAGLVVVTWALGMGLMIGLNTTPGRSPLGRALAWAFEEFPSTIAFRTTHKIGSMLVLASALAIGAGVGSAAWRRVFAVSRTTATTIVAVVVVVAAGPLLPGQLHPLQMPVPDYWFEAARATDHPSSDRLLLLPGNAQTRYVWGYRGVDDLDTALFDDRHVTWRSTIPAGSLPATNLLTAMDTQLQLGRLAASSLSTYTRLIGAGEALVRTDTDWLRNYGRPTSAILDEVERSPATEVTDTFGPTGAERGLAEPGVVDSSDPALTRVELPDTTIVQAWRLDAPLLVVGDAMAVDQLVRAGFDPADRPLLYVHDLDDDQLRAALDAGGEFVVTDTNHRRRWSIGSVTDSYSPVLPSDVSVPAAEQRAVSTEPATQTVALPREVEVTASTDPNAVIRTRAAGHPALAFDRDRQTAWQYGTNATAEGGWVEIRVPRAASVQQATIHVRDTDQRAITQLQVKTAARSLTIPVVDGRAHVQLADTTDHLRVTITATSGEPSDQPVGINEIDVRGDTAWVPPPRGLRLPETLQLRAEQSPELADRMARADVTVLLARLSGAPADPFDDEESRMVREVTVPTQLRVSPGAVDVVARAVGGFIDAGTCRGIARVIDGAGERHLVRAVPVEDAATAPATRMEGCGDPIDLAAGAIRIQDLPGITIDHLALGTADRESEVPRSMPVQVPASSRTDHTIRLPRPQAVPTLVSSGQAWSPNWTATADGQPLGDPLIAGGYAAGWVVPPGTETVVVTYRPQGHTRMGHWTSLATLVAALVVAVRARRARP